MNFSCDDEVCAQVQRLHSAVEICEYLQAWLESHVPEGRRWEAISVDGDLLIPESYHVVDALVGHFELWEEGTAWEYHSGLGVVAYLYREEQCVVCKADSARYDSAVRPGDRWGFMCGSCYRLNSDGVLGMGLGQYLLSPELDSGPWLDMYKHIHVVKFGEYP